ncbi:hypothetical protein ACHAXT_002497 [Thalassiosira profunda]
MGRYSFRSRPDATTAPELPTIATWIRLALGAMFGVSLGLRNDTRGLIGAMYGLNLIAFMPMFWFNTYLDAKVDTYKSLNFVGVPNAFALMLLIWIAIFTLRHEEAEALLAKIISDASTDADAGVTEPIVEATPGGVESEF